MFLRPGYDVNNVDFPLPPPCLFFFFVFLHAHSYRRRCLEVQDTLVSGLRQIFPWPLGSPCSFPFFPYYLPVAAKDGGFVLPQRACRLFTGVSRLLLSFFICGFFFSFFFLMRLPHKRRRGLSAIS